MKIEAIIFDCDGLMFDTETNSHKIWIEEAKRLGINLPSDFWTSITGAKNDGHPFPKYAHIPHIDELWTTMHVKRFDPDFWASFACDALNKKGLLQLYKYLEEHHIRKAVGSSSGFSYVNALIQNVSIPMHFDAIITGDMVSHGKPDPEIFLKAAEALNIEPEHCLVLEDSKQGVMATRRGGMHSCFIQDTIIPDEEMKQYIEFQKENLAQVIDLL